MGRTGIQQRIISGIRQILLLPAPSPAALEGSPLTLQSRSAREHKESEKCISILHIIKTASFKNIPTSGNLIRIQTKWPLSSNIKARLLSSNRENMNPPLYISFPLLRKACFHDPECLMGKQRVLKAEDKLICLRLLSEACLWADWAMSMAPEQLGIFSSEHEITARSAGKGHLSRVGMGNL